MQRVKPTRSFSNSPMTSARLFASPESERHQRLLLCRFESDFPSYISRFLSLENFRNLRPLNLKFSSSVSLFKATTDGAKPTFAGAIFCATGNAFRRATHQQIVHHQAESRTVGIGLNVNHPNHNIEIALAPETEHQVDGRISKKPLRSLNY